MYTYIRILVLIHTHLIRKFVMSKKIIYRNQLLSAIEAFLERTSAATMRVHRIIERCSLAINGEDTLDNFIWSFYFQALKDSVYFESE